MSRRILTLILFVGLAATAAFAPRHSSQRAAGLPNFTIPSPTPPPTNTPIPPPTNTPTSVPPTNPPPTNPPPTNPPPTNPPPPAATATPLPPAPTATATAVPPAASPVGPFLPTAVACGEPPTLQAQSSARIRSGPGTDYAAIGSLVSLEVRVIVGRAPDVPWWLIEMPGGGTGWVADQVVLVQGYTGNVPLIPFGGQAATPGPAWQPTAQPGCAAPPPTSAASASSTATAQPAATTAVSTATALPQPTNTATSTATDARQPTSTATSVVPAGAATVVAQAANQPAGANPDATAAPLDPNTDADSSPAAALPCASALMGVAVAAFIVSRRFW